jgi:hypothetical protein
MTMQRFAETSTLRTSAVEARDAAHASLAVQTSPAPGFRHFLGTPLPSQRFHAFGIDPIDSSAVQPKLRKLMHRLSRRMDAEIYWPPHGNALAEHWENPIIPSGYTYLLQFVAHDMVHSAIPLSVAGTLGAGTANARRVPLRLETLYGSGPVGSPHIYALDAPNDDRRTKLRLGRMRWKEKEPASGCPFRDIARTGAENVTGIDRSIAGMRVALTEALVADPRNDDHAVMSQLTALLALLHNSLIDHVRRQETGDGPNARFGAAYRRFLCVREAVTLIYHNILRNDLLRRLIHPSIYAAYAGVGPSFIDRPDQDTATGDWQIPFEFSHGAFRFGHAMVRPEYNINDLSNQDLYNTLEKTSANDPVNMPLDETWMIRWSHFFEINGSKPNYSRRIGPYLSDGLGNDQIFPAFDETERVGLLYRDLLGSGIAGMWSVDALIAEIAARRPQFIAMSRLLFDRSYRVSQLREWLAAAPAYGALTAEDIETLSNDPPLPFFILFEAMLQPNAEGLRLGPLGSLIASEVIFGALAGDPRSSGGSSLADQLAELSRENYPANVFRDIPDISSMAQLVEFVTEIAELKQAVPAFL